jgi:hypothetical protein
MKQKLRAEVMKSHFSTTTYSLKKLAILMSYLGNGLSLH